MHQTVDQRRKSRLLGAGVQEVVHSGSLPFRLRDLKNDEVLETLKR